MVCVDKILVCEGAFLMPRGASLAGRPHGVQIIGRLAGRGGPGSGGWGNRWGCAFFILCAGPNPPSVGLKWGNIAIALASPAAT